MTTNEELADIERLLSVLQKEEEFIIKPFRTDIPHKFGTTVECGKIVSRMNKTLFDYQIGDKANTSIMSSIFIQSIKLSNPETKQVVLELYCNRLPFLCKISCKQDVRCSIKSSNEPLSIGSIQQRLVFGKIWYDVYNNKYEHVISLMLRKSHLLSKIHHRILDFEILDNDEMTNIGRIYPFSTDLEKSHYGHAVAIKLPQDMKVEIKAISLIAALILKIRLN